MTDYPIEVQAVLDSALKLVDAWDTAPTRAEENDAATDLHMKVIALRASKSPPTPHRCEPAEADRGEAYHWLLAEGVSSDPDIFEWIGDRWARFGGDNLTPEEIHEIGWRYHSPAIPPAQQTPEDKTVPSDEAIRSFAADYWIKPTPWHINIIRAALSRFKSPQPVEISDEEIEALADSLPNYSKCGPDGKTMHSDYCVTRAFSREKLIRFARSILAKGNPK